MSTRQISVTAMQQEKLKGWGALENDESSKTWSRRIVENYLMKVRLLSIRWGLGRGLYRCRLSVVIVFPCFHSFRLPGDCSDCCHLRRFFNSFVIFQISNLWNTISHIFHFDSSSGIILIGTGPTRLTLKRAGLFTNM